MKFRSYVRFFCSWALILLMTTVTSANLELSEVDLMTGIIEITNTANAAFSGDLLEWCIPFSYGALEGSSFTFAAGETRTYNMGTGALSAADDLWIYLDRTGGFGDETKVTSGVVWGSNQMGQGRVNAVVADTGGAAWADPQDFVDTSSLGPGLTLQLKFPGDQPNMSSGWEIAAENLGTFACGADGDFNSSGGFDLGDIDLLTEAIATGSTNADFDLNCDTAIDTADLDLWLADAGAALNSSGNPFLPGDADLSGSVDGADFLAWNDNKFQNETAWSKGNFDANLAVDAADFIIWNDNKFQSADAVVPEPTSATILLLALLAVAPCRKQSSLN